MQCTLPHPAPPCTTAAHDIVYDIEAKRRREELAEQQPQVHILGEILGGTGFTGAVCCKWAVEAGTPQGENLWVLVEGDEAGQTQTDYPVQGTDVAVWSHPLDVHYNAGGRPFPAQGWPRMLLSVWHLDDDGRLELQGYGVLHVPCTPGSYEVSCPTWRPAGTPSQEMAAAFVGGVPHLKSTSVLYTDQQHRKNIATVSSGTVRDVHVRFDVVMRNFHTYGVDLAQAATATTAAGV
ncbi:b9d2 [Symbiodinium sp. KB8]|nr:b9d2 [Symbiodinium sp. KB8]